MALRPGYILREVAASLRRHALISFAAISTAFIALFLLGGALLIDRQVGLVVDATTAKVEVAVYLRDEITPQERASLNRQLASMPEVATVEYESKQEAYDRFKRIFANQQDLVRSVGPGALPASLRVKLVDPEDYPVVARRLAGEPGIDRIVDQRAILKRLFAVTRVFRVGVGAVAIVMLVAAGALIANTVRMGIFARRKEIGIMRLVGATNWFIRIPFLLEGMIQGLVGATAAIVGLFVLKVVFVDPLRNQIGFMPLLQTQDMMYIVPILLAAGVGVAVVASVLGMSRFLEV